MGTSHLDGVNPYHSAVYITSGEAQGKINGILMDIHGAGAQRSDPKSCTANNYPEFFVLKVMFVMFIMQSDV
ncbi:hypothetical protein ACFL4B_01335 [Candidatus Neomarinimicrobiota bacterium]